MGKVRSQAALMKRAQALKDAIIYLNGVVADLEVTITEAEYALEAGAYDGIMETELHSYMERVKDKIRAVLYHESAVGETAMSAAAKARGVEAALAAEDVLMKGGAQ